MVIDDEWGTHRGYIWRIGLENYKEFPLIHKIFGYGPDTFGIVTVNNNYDEMVSRYNEIFDSAHNEYLQYFVTIGPFGLISYLVLLVSAVLRMVRRAGDNPYVVAAAFSVAVSYTHLRGSLFLNRFGGPITASGIRSQLKIFAVRYNIDPEVCLLYTSRGDKISPTRFEGDIALCWKKSGNIVAKLRSSLCMDEAGRLY